MVEEGPRLRSTGLPLAATFRKSEKFFMLRAPIWSMSAYSATAGRVSESITSVTTLRPVASRASARSFSPSSAMPWNS